MSLNSSSTSNPHHFCTSIEVSAYMYDSISTLRILLLLPLSTFVLYLGHQRWQQQRSSKTATHSDIFAYHMAVMELIGVLGCFWFFAGTYTHHVVSMIAGMYISSIPLFGQSFLHILTCVERYLAVVHPITYMGLRNARGVRIRNICISCAWLLCSGLPTVSSVNLPDSTFIPLLCLLLFFTVAITFCSLSVLFVLNRPGPGEGSREKERVDQSKQRAFYTTTAISVTVWLWFLGLIVYSAVYTSPLNESVRCVVMSSVNLLNLPSSLVSPLLYLHRAGKLSCCS